MDRQARTPVQIMWDSVHALFIRELRTRFGGSRLGYFWAMFEPAAQAAIMATIFSLIGRSSVAGVEVGLFLVCGLVPFKLFSKLITQTSNAISSNRGVMTYRQVEPIDPVITRYLIEITTFILVFVILLFLMGWLLGYDVIPSNPLGVVGAVFLLSMISSGLGLLFCSFVAYWEDFTKLLGVVMTPMMIISGVLFSASMIPTQYWYLLDWNPVFHAIELIRESYFATYYAGFGSWEYLLELVLLTWFMALLGYLLNRTRFMIQ